MKLNIWKITFFTGLIFSFSSLNKAVTVADNPFNSVDFPLEYCGDLLPKNKSAYPVKLYTVFINDTNGEQIKDKISQYCKQTLYAYKRKIDGSIPRGVIQIASLIGRDRAEQFKEFLSRDFENVEISEPTVITANTVNYSEAKTNISSIQEIAKAALLNETQLNALLEIDRTLAVITVGSLISTFSKSRLKNSLNCSA
ncbi:MAG: hypothetical protein F6K24_25650, partial [Okeania sp. SIO2D1]|nr:hypothetical protein [Okeania sp. SIO2D1]